jgi:hypothetical protein
MGRLEEGLETFYHLVDRALPPACSSRLLGESRDYGGTVLVTAELPDLSASKGEGMDPVSVTISAPCWVWSARLLEVRPHRLLGGGHDKR